MSALPTGQAKWWQAGLTVGLIAAAIVGIAWPGNRGGELERCRGTASCQPAPGRRPSQSNRPNIVVIMTDDQDASSMWVMPNVGTLIAQPGATFSNSFVSTPECCPSRASFLTGQYAHNHGVLTNWEPLGGYIRLDHENTLPVWLERAGYRTAHIGKYLNGYGVQVPPTTIPPGWTEWYGVVGGPFYNYQINANGELRSYGSTADDYDTDVFARLAVRFIERSQAFPGTPFFLYVAFHAPHVLPQTQVPVPAPRHLGRFAHAPLPKPPSFNEENISDKPSWVRVLRPFGPLVVGFITEDYRRGLEALLGVDEAVHDIVAALERTGKLQNTVIIYTSDNGFFKGEHRIPTGKGPLYEEGIRVPLIIRGPDLPEGVTFEHLVVNIDLAPTIAESAGAVPGLQVDGCSLIPLLRNPLIPWRRDFLIETWLNKESPIFAGVRTARYVYVETFVLPRGEQELYDLSNDPFQLENLIDGHRADGYGELIPQLKKRLQELKTSTGPACGQSPSTAHTAGGR